MRKIVIAIFVALFLTTFMAYPASATTSTDTISLSIDVAASSTSPCSTVTSAESIPINVTVTVSNATPADEVWYMVGTNTLDVGSGTMIAAGDSATFELGAAGFFAFVSSTVVDITATCSAVASHAQNIDYPDAIVATSTSVFVKFTSISALPMNISLAPTGAGTIEYMNATSSLLIGQGATASSASPAVFMVEPGASFCFISTDTMGVIATSSAGASYSMQITHLGTLTATSTLSTVAVTSVATYPMYVTIWPVSSETMTFALLNGTTTMNLASSTLVSSNSLTIFELAPLGSFCVLGTSTASISATCADVTSYTRQIATSSTVTATSTTIASRIYNTSTVPVYFTLASNQATFTSLVHFAEGSDATLGSDWIPANASTEVFTLAVDGFISVLSSSTVAITINSAEIGSMSFSTYPGSASFDATMTVGIVSMAHNATENANIVVTLDSTPADAIVYYDEATTTITFGGNFKHAHAGEAIVLDIASGETAGLISNKTIGCSAECDYIDINKVVQLGSPQPVSYATTRIRTLTMPWSSTRYKLTTTLKATGTVHINVNAAASTTAGVGYDVTYTSPLTLDIPPGGYVSVIATEVIPLEYRLKKAIRPRPRDQRER